MTTAQFIDFASSQGWRIDCDINEWFDTTIYIQTPNGKVIIVNKEFIFGRQTALGYEESVNQFIEGRRKLAGVWIPTFLFIVAFITYLILR